MIDFVKKYKIAVIAALIALTALVIAFMLGGNPEEKENNPADQIKTAATVDSVAETSSAVLPSSTKKVTTPSSSASTQSVTQSVTKASSSIPTATVSAQLPTVSSKAAVAVADTRANTLKPTVKPTEKPKRTSTDKYKTTPVPQGKPEPVEPQEQTEANKKSTVTMSISCASVLNDINKLDEDKREIIPPDGWILKSLPVTINEGESVFDLLKRVCRDKKIHMEFSFTPVYNSAYIEGIGNLYEFDCGSSSGWMYRVDSWFPNYGSSRYVLHGGETIEWLYTTNMGNDIGGSNQQWGE